jgi:hypothetical protein
MARFRCLQCGQHARRIVKQRRDVNPRDVQCGSLVVRAWRAGVDVLKPRIAPMLDPRAVLAALGRDHELLVELKPMVPEDALNTDRLDGEWLQSLSCRHGPSGRVFVIGTAQT